ncbi:ISL3 family transposase [Streptomyces sp. NPDC102384]|uniref:ISL3 family transposase n=1 Tax=Streptomyces sp. NPDC102384 TaxID=3366166 RepID=UPI0038248CA9
MDDTKMPLASVLFPTVLGVVLTTVHTVDGVLRIEAATTADRAHCPDCRHGSERIHGSYLRFPADVPIAGQPVVIVLRVRRFVCVNTACQRRTFVEQVEGLTRRFGRWTERLRVVLGVIGLALAGRAGSRLAGQLGIRVSKNTVLRTVMELPVLRVRTPRVLGIDEFALRKGHVYGTILVDVETRQPIDLLPDRTVPTVTDWLVDHPGVEVICRDRAIAFAEAGRLGAPGAIHVADRWHIWKNLAEAVEKTVVHHRALLRAPDGGDRIRTQPILNLGTLALAVPTEPRRTGRLSERVRDQHAAVHALLAQGMGLRPIGRRLGLARNTVRRLARAAGPDELLVGQWTGRASILDPYKPFLHQRWAEGQTIGTRLFEELREQGFRGGDVVVRKYVRRLRDAFPHQQPGSPPSVRNVTSWITRHPASLTAEQSEQLKTILTRCPALQRTAHHIRAFAELMNKRDGQYLPQWIAQVQDDDLPALHTFITGLGQDLDAVVAGLSLPYSSGVVEGHNNRIKMLKRQMYGRASLQLLRQRVLLA